MKDYYYLLGVNQSATKREIKTAYKKLSKKFHPDLNEEDDFFTQRFQEINEAYEVLSNPRLRSSYDLRLSSQEPKIFDVQKEKAEHTLWRHTLRVVSGKLKSVSVRLRTGENSVARGAVYSMLWVILTVIYSYNVFSDPTAYEQLGLPLLILFVNIFFFSFMAIRSKWVYQWEAVIYWMIGLIHFFNLSCVIIHYMLDIENLYLAWALILLMTGLFGYLFRIFLLEALGYIEYTED